MYKSHRHSISTLLSQNSAYKRGPTNSHSVQCKTYTLHRSATGARFPAGRSSPGVQPCLLCPDSDVWQMWQMGAIPVILPASMSARQPTTTIDVQRTPLWRIPDAMQHPSSTYSKEIRTSIQQSGTGSGAHQTTTAPWVSSASFSCIICAYPLAASVILAAASTFVSKPNEVLPPCELEPTDTGWGLIVG